MMTQEAVLRLLARRTEHKQSTGYENLAEELWLSPEAPPAGTWRASGEAALIEAEGDRRARFQFRLELGESLRTLRFTLAPRGRERLRWYEEVETQEGWGLGWL